jgi:hypothetical protein
VIVAAVLVGILVPASPSIEPIPDTPDVIVRDREWETLTRPEPIRAYDPGSPAEPAPVDEEPEPFYCRTEAPFPQEECIPPPEPAEPADPADPDEPEVTPGDVVEAVKRVGLPRLSVAVQPAGSTLVNLETIFHTTAAPFERTVLILGSTVDLRAKPATYTWHHGDGTTQTTERPGRPYPALDVTHRYSDPGNVAARVDVTYAVTYRIDSRGWQDLGTTITAQGPATTLRIREARPVLTQ